MSIEALFAAVYATPDDLAVRGVLADALLAAGDPRGDFLAEQLAGHALSPSSRALVERDWQRWLGPLATCTRFDGIRFHDGFLSSLVVATPPVMNRLQWHRVVRAPQWSTVSALSIERSALVTASSDHLATILLDADTRSLRELTAPLEVLRHVRDRDRPFALETLRILVLDDRIALDPVVLRGAHVEILRTGYCLRDQGDLDACKLAADAGVASLTIATPTSSSLSQIVANAVVANVRRPHHLAYRTYHATTRLRRRELEVDFVDDSASSRSRLVATTLHPFITCLSDFETVTLRIERTRELLFEGTGEEAVIYLRAAIAETATPGDNFDDAGE